MLMAEVFMTKLPENQNVNSFQIRWIEWIITSLNINIIN